MLFTFPYILLILSVSTAMTLALIFLNKILGNKFIDNTDGIQKFHKTPTPRLGGLSIFFSFIITVYLIINTKNIVYDFIVISALPIFIIGMIEDIKRNINPNHRLLAAFTSGFLFIILTGYYIKKLDIIMIDNLLSIYIVAILITSFAISGVINAINIIDGFHGLASGSLVIMFSGFALIGWTINDYLIVDLAIVSLLIYLGFLFINFPFGLIFLGDAGAYFGGFLLSVLAIILPFRNPEISPWVSFLLCSYPIIETIFSIYRKIKRKGHHPSRPDGLHLHMLIYRDFSRKIAKRLNLEKFRNAITSMVLWVLPILSCIICFFFYEQEVIIIISVVLIALLYILIYRKVSLNL